MSSGSKIKNGVFALFAPEDPKPIVLVRLGQAYRDYQRKGFFRIGLLPAGVFEGVTFEIMNTGTTSNRLSHLDEWVRPAMSGAIEMRKVKISWASGTKSLEAGRIRMAPKGAWELLDGVRLTADGKTKEIRRATLQVTGSHAGELQAPAQPEWTRNLFSEEPQPKETHYEKNHTISPGGDDQPDPRRTGTDS